MSLREKLKATTKSLHDLSEQLNYSDKIFTHTLTLDEYTTLLKRNLLLHQQAELLFAAHSDTFPDLQLPQRIKVPLITKDLAQYNISFTAAHFMQFERLDAAEFLGFMYVSEGATLGGAVIAKHLEKIPSIKEIATDFHYLHGYRADLGSRWQSYLATLDQYSTLHPAEDWKIINGAKMAFLYFLNVSYSLV